MLEEERTSLIKEVVRLLTKMTTMSAVEGDDAVLGAIRKMDEGIARLNDLITGLARSLERGGP